MLWKCPMSSAAPFASVRIQYELLQFHFHAPSEHKVNGQFAAAELHLVHRNALLDIAVVGVLVTVGSPVNTVIDHILRNAPTERREKSSYPGPSTRKTCCCAIQELLQLFRLIDHASLQ